MLKGGIIMANTNRLVTRIILPSHNFFDFGMVMVCSTWTCMTCVLRGSFLTHTHLVKAFFLANMWALTTLLLGRRRYLVPERRGPATAVKNNL